MSEQTNAHTKLSGNVERISYSNKENGFTVLLLKTDSERITVVGTLPFVSVGDDIIVEGSYTVHPSFGNQFKAVSFEKLLPSDAAAILRYLSSGAVKGVGPATARRIVERFGNNTLDIIENEHNRLCEIKGISASKADAVHEEYIKQISLRDVMLSLSRFKVLPDEALCIYKTLGKDAMDLIAQNAFVLCCNEIGFSFDRAQDIAEYYGMAKNDRYRLEAGIEWVLRHNMANSGHTCLPEEKMLSVAGMLLECDTEEIETAYYNLCDAFRLTTKEIDGRNFVFLPEYYDAEKYISARVAVMCDNISALAPVSDLEIDYVEGVKGVRFDKKQRDAVKIAVETGALVLTGGPGTGKTTILNAIIQILERRNLNVLLAAPTGRAAKRMSQVSEREAKTLHRLLEASMSPDNRIVFLKDESNQLDCDAIIVDEMSMVDTQLFASLLKALPLTARVILVGDTDQLPSIGAGNVLQDIIDADILPSVRLDRVFRQAKESKIIVNAHAIINNDKVDFSAPDGDCFFIREFNTDSAVDTVLSLVCERLPAAYGFSSLDNIQVLCPSRKQMLGTTNLNNVLQNAINPKDVNTLELFSKGFYFRAGDKVMQIRNNYDIAVTDDDGSEVLGVYNGDIGIVEAVDTIAHTLSVRYENGVATYSEDALSELELAYAVTVHKSQGSEFDCVVLPLLDTPSLLRYRNLLYTAVTRAKKLLVVVGEMSVFAQMVENNRKTKRYTGLKTFIEDAINGAR